ncbi:MAG: TIGR00730 family Rossman fold protein [Myxococcota bacterium]
MPRSKRTYTLDDANLNDALDGLLAGAAARYGNDAGLDLVREMVVTSLRLLRDGADRGDLRLVNSALKELRHSFRVFRPYEHVRKVAVFGSARTAPSSPEWKQAEAFAERIVDAGWMVITGAGGGIMAAAQGGAGREASFGVNIRLPFEQVANPTIAGDEKLINFRYFFTRKVTFVRESHAIVLLPGGFGTLDEGFEALTLIQTGKSELLPVVFLDAPGGRHWRDWLAFVEGELAATGRIDRDDLALFRVTDDVDEALREIRNFYSNYHSSRHVRDQLVLRLRKAPTAAQLAELEREFAPLLGGEGLAVGPPHPDERGEVPDYARLFLRPDRRRVGLLRKLVDRLNEEVAETESPAGDAVAHQIVPAAFGGDERRSLDDVEEEEG